MLCFYRIRIAQPYGDVIHIRPSLPTFPARSTENMAITSTLQFILRAVELHEVKQSLERH
jgi:hypothetical protein